jgi:hypothetical protein
MCRRAPAMAMGNAAYDLREDPPSGSCCHRLRTTLPWRAPPSGTGTNVVVGAGAPQPAAAWRQAAAWAAARARCAAARHARKRQRAGSTVAHPRRTCPGRLPRCALGAGSGAPCNVYWKSCISPFDHINARQRLVRRLWEGGRQLWLGRSSWGGGGLRLGGGAFRHGSHRSTWGPGNGT